MAHSCVTCVALGLAQHQLPLRSNCCHHHSHRRHHQQADLDAPCFLSSARAMLFQLFQVGLPAASSWVLPAPLSHPCDPSRARGLSCSLSAFFPRCLAMVGGKRSSKLCPLLPFCGLHYSLLRTERDPPQALFSPDVCSRYPGTCSSQQNLMELSSSSHCGCHCSRLDWQKLLPGTLKWPSNLSLFLQALPTFPD